MTEAGNWEGHNILNLPRTIGQAAKLLGRDEGDLRAELAAGRAELLAVRDRRVPPAKDTKVLVSWNGLMIAALAEAGRILKDERYLDAASRAAGFILDRMRREDGRLLHTFKDGRARLDAYLDDYANLIDGLTRLYEATGEPRWIESALELTRVMLDEFSDPEHGGFFFTGHHHEALIARQKDYSDNATPSGNAMAATALVRLGALTGRDDFTQAGRSALESVQLLLEREPAAAGQSLIALDFLLGSIREFAVIAGSDAAEFRSVLETIATAVPTPQGRRPSDLRAGLDPREQSAVARRSPAAGGPDDHLHLRELRLPAPVVGVEGVEAALRDRGS